MAIRPDVYLRAARHRRERMARNVSVLALSVANTVIWGLVVAELLYR